jgi:uroporphyrinogen-III synthase
VRVVLTQTEPGRVAGSLRAAGFDVAECPLVRVEPLSGPPITAEGYDWLVLTSRNAVEPLLSRLDGPLPPVAVVGSGTADALRARGIAPALVAHDSTQEGLAAELPRPAGRVLFAGAKDARDVLGRELGADFVPLYRTVELRPQRFPDADLVVLASPSAARAYAAIRRSEACVVVGPVTAAEAGRLGLEVVAEAERPGPDGVVDAVKLAASRIGSSRS